MKEEVKVKWPWIVVRDAEMNTIYVECQRCGSDLTLCEADSYHVEDLVYSMDHFILEHQFCPPIQLNTGSEEEKFSAKLELQYEFRKGDEVEICGVKYEVLQVVKISDTKWSAELLAKKEKNG